MVMITLTIWPHYLQWKCHLYPSVRRQRRPRTRSQGYRKNRICTLLGTESRLPSRTHNSL